MEVGVSSGNSANVAEWYHVKGMRMWAESGLARAIPEESMLVEEASIGAACCQICIANIL